MRFNALVLDKFGPFTGRRLDFRPGARLHVIHGANEAGKSTALAAAHALLFGVPERTSYDFLHKSTDLRIGGEIEARDGRRLTFRRRKGRKRVLSDDAGTDLPDDILSQYLGGLGEDVFTRAFGLDAGSLRQGARELMASQSEVGESLMAAASGLRLHGLRRELDEEADRLFAPRKSNDRLIYQILDRYEAARRQSNELELGAGKWKKLNEDIDGQTGELNAVLAQRRELQTRLHHLHRLSLLKPQMARIDAEAAKLQALGALPDLPAGFGAALIAAVEAAQTRAAAAQEAEMVCTDIDRECSGISVDAGLLAQGVEIVDLFSRTGAYRGARGDLPRIQSESSQFRAGLAEKATALGLADPAGVEDRLPTAAAQARVTALIREGADLAQQRAQIASALADEQERLLALDTAQKSRGMLRDPAPWREKLAAFGDIAALAQRLSEADAAARQEANALAQDAARLLPPVRDLDAIANAALPGAATLARFRSDFDAAAETMRDARIQAEACRREIAALQSKLAELAGRRPVPSPERIEAARAERQALWAPVRAAAFAETGAPAGPALAGAVATFEAAMTQADRLADEGARDATRVAAWANASLSLADRQRHGVEFDRAVAQAEARLAGCDNEWRGLWAPLGVAPLPPVEMTAWLASLDGLLQRRDKLAAQRQARDQMRGELSALGAPLAALALETGLEPIDGLDAVRQGKRIADRIRAAAEFWDAARGDAQSRADTQTRIERILRQRDEADALHASWTGQWDEALGALNVRRGASLDEARAVLELWRDTPPLLSAQKNRQSRVDGMIRDIDAFETATARIVAAHAPDLTAHDAAHAIEALHERLNEARRAEALHKATVERRNAALAALAKARAAHEQTSRDRDRIAARAPAGADLREFGARLMQRDEIAARLDDLRAQLREQAGAVEEAQLRAELSALDADAAKAEHDALAEEDARLDARAKEAYAARDRSERQRGEWEKGVGAEVALQQRHNAEAELREAARDWAVLKIGSLLLGRALERHRASRHDPLMQRAGEFFAILTGGAFTGLEQDYGDDDQARLAGRRADGALVRIDGAKESDRSPMSTGTLDQLYLALRLAYIEDYCTRAEPIPFIGDDLFTSFDDARTGFGVDALASLSAHTQPILFTHHRHVVDIARARLGADLDVIELN